MKIFRRETQTNPWQENYYNKLENGIDWPKIDQNEKRFYTIISLLKAYDLAMDIFELSKSFPKKEIYSLTDQIRRSSGQCVQTLKNHNEEEGILSI